MGTNSNHAIIVSGYKESLGDASIHEIRQKCIEIIEEVTKERSAAFPDPDDIVSPVIGPVVNGIMSFFIAPDGSKEWWDSSNCGDEIRQQIVEYLSTDRVWSNWVVVRYGELGNEIEDCSYG